MELRVVNQLHIVLDADEANMFCNIITKLSKKKPPIGFTRSDTKLVKGEIEFIRSIRDRICPEENIKQERKN